MKCYITVYPTIAKLAGFFPAPEIETILSYKVKNYYFSPAFKRGKWDGTKTLYDKKSKSFPIGLLNVVLRTLKRNGYAYEVIDNRQIPKKVLASHGLVGIENLWPHQQEAIDKIFECKNGIIQIPTGGGKTMLAMAITNMLQTKTIVLTPTNGKNLQQQLYDSFIKHLNINPTSGMIGKVGGGCNVPGEWITIATPKTLHKNLGILEGTQLIFQDECHEAGGETIYNILSKCPATYKIGLSATPLNRSDGNNFKVVAALGDIIYKAKESDLADNNCLLLPTVYIIPIDRPKLINKMKWTFVLEHGIISNEYRNKVICDQAYQMAQKDMKVLIIVQRVEHGKNILEMFKKEYPQVECNYVNGQPTKVKEKKIVKKTIKRFTKEEFPVLISTNKLLGQGFDMKNLDAIIRAGGGKSEISDVQESGRPMRYLDGKGTCIVIDFADLTHRILSDHTSERILHYESRQYNIKILDINN